MMNRNQILEELQSWKAGSKSCLDYWPPRYNKYDETDHALLDEVARVTGHHSLYWRAVEKVPSILADAVARCDRTGAGLTVYCNLGPSDATSEIFRRKWQAVAYQMPPGGPVIDGVVVDYEVPYLPGYFEQNEKVHEFNVAMYRISNAYSNDALYTRYGHGSVGFSSDRWQHGRYSLVGSDPSDTGWSVGLYDSTDRERMSNVLGRVIQNADMHHVYSGSVWVMCGLRSPRKGEVIEPGTAGMSTMPYDLKYSKTVGEMFGGHPWYSQAPPNDHERAYVWAWTQRVKAIHVFPGPADYGSSWEHLYAMLSGVRR